MADNILTTDRASANLDIAAKEISSVKYPRNIITDPSGNDITPLTDTALRATPVPVSGTVSVTGAATAANQATEIASLASLDTKAPALGQALAAASVPVVLTAAQVSTLTPPAAITGYATEATLDARTGSLTESAPGTDTASSGLNGRLQRIAQRVTSLIALLPASLGPKAGASSLSVVESVPTTVTIVSLQTNATGTTYNAFGSQACEMLDIVNTATAAVDLEVRRGGSGNTIVVPSGSSRMFVGLANASDLQVRRLDQSNTQITFTGEAIKQ